MLFGLDLSEMVWAVIWSTELLARFGVAVLTLPRPMMPPPFRRNAKWQRGKVTWCGEFQRGVLWSQAGRLLGPK